MSDLLEIQGILYPSNLERFRRKRTFSTATGDFTQNATKLGVVCLEFCTAF
jgi:hypothetical protein